jgi:diamine N-acetyltransferase
LEKWFTRVDNIRNLNASNHFKATLQLDIIDKRMTIIKADNKNDFKKIEILAYEIIPEFYVDVIPHDHNVFFVNKFQSVKAIEEQLKNGYEYYLIKGADIFIGYFGLQISVKDSHMFLSKLYLLKEHRGLGFGTKAMDFILERAKKLNLTQIILTVNRKNEKTIELYKKYGFSITKDLVNTFENGHTILDYEIVTLPIFGFYSVRFLGGVTK